MATLHLCAPQDMTRLAPLMARFAEEFRLPEPAAAREAAVAPLLAGSPYGAAYLIGPPRTPVGYLVVTFGWSIEFGGMEGWIDEIYIREAVRGRGIATEALAALIRALREVDVRALHLEADREDRAAQRLYLKSGFELRDRYSLMTYWL